MSVPTTNFTLKVPSAAVERIATAFCASYGYQATLEDGTPNPQTPLQFTQRRLMAYIKEVVISYEANDAAETARETAAADADSALTLET